MPERKPNLLFIFTDEQRSDTLACYGNRNIQTPNLNKLADESVVFEQAYVTQSVCTPSRSSILTGLYPHTNGCTANNIPLRPETRTIAEMVSPEYTRAYYGKWHLGDEIIPQHGFPDWVSIEDMYRPHYSKPEYLARFSSYHHFLLENGFSPDREKKGVKIFDRMTAANLPEQFTKASFIGREAARFIKEKSANPFMLFVNFLEPHMPFTGPLNERYSGYEWPATPHFLEAKLERASRRHQLLNAKYMNGSFEGFDLADTANWHRIRGNYWGLITMVDNAVGVILDALAQSGQADNTLVVFTSDHGDLMGDHGILGKCAQYEEAVKVPLLMRIPWLTRNRQVVKDRISQIDLAPTLLELMGETIPEHLEGASRVKVLEGQGSLADNDVFVEWNGPDGISKAKPLLGLLPEEIERIRNQPWRTVVAREGWKLNLSPGDQGELFDLNRDPYERNNLFDAPDQKQRLHELAARIRAWQKQTHDTVEIPEL